MFREEVGSSAGDPLFLMLLAEGDGEEAMTYSHQRDAGTLQHNLRVEIEDSSFDDPDAGQQVIATELQHVDDKIVTNLIRSKQMKKTVIGPVKSKMPPIIPDTAVTKPLDAAVAALIARRSKK